MSITEYLLFIPLLIYGMVLSRLLAEWKRFFDRSNWHGPYLVTVVIFTEVAIWNIYAFLGLFEGAPDTSYPTYLAMLVPPFVLLLAVNALLTDDNLDGLIDPDEFERRMGLAYFFMGCFIVLHLLPLFRGSGDATGIRLAAALVLFAIAWFRRPWLIYALAVVWLVSLYWRVSVAS